MRIGTMVRIMALMGFGLVAACGGKPKKMDRLNEHVTKKHCQELIEKAKSEAPRPDPSAAPRPPAACAPQTVHTIAVSAAPIIDKFTHNGNRIELLKTARPGQTFTDKTFGISIHEIAQQADCKVLDPAALAQTSELNISLGDGITVSDLKVDRQTGRLVGSISVDKGALPGKRDLTVAFQGKTVAKIDEYFSVVKGIIIIKPPDAMISGRDVF